MKKKEDSILNILNMRYNKSFHNDNDNLNVDDTTKQKKIPFTTNT